EQQEQQKEESQKKDAPAPAPAGAATVSPNPITAEGAAEKKEDKKWDVNNPPGPHHDVAIDVSEGTWLSLDVSPDGREIAFDLLGDIYSIPISGGEAKALTSGVAWDMQPRYSPNGRWIAFTSDRSGGDNIWIMNRDGSNPQQVTKESFRLLNQPSWTPDSVFIVARKHFSSERSLGAGEMWLYHRSGEIERYITGPGGSIRPNPSHDGKSLAFVRRVRYKSTLYIRDLQSGRETPLYNGLDRDMQETWAIHGVYPSMAWTPDDKAIV